MSGNFNRSKYKDHELVGGSRSEAREKGLTTYFTGNKCVHGHVSPRFACSGVCCECNRTVHRKHQVDHVRRKKASNEWVNYIDRVNLGTRKKAFSSYKRWGDSEIRLLFACDGESRYLYPASDLTKMLGRSYRSIERARHRFKPVIAKADDC